jgi:hypothetical protein
MFRINSADDRKDMMDYIPDRRIVFDRLPLKYFWLYSDDMDKAIKCKPIVIPKKLNPV